MKKIAVYSRSHLDKLEDVINNWLETNDDVTILDIKLSTTYSREDNVVTTVLIYFDDT